MTDPKRPVLDPTRTETDNGHLKTEHGKRETERRFEARNGKRNGVSNQEMENEKRKMGNGKRKGPFKLSPFHDHFLAVSRCPFSVSRFLSSVFQF